VRERQQAPCFRIIVLQRISEGATLHVVFREMRERFHAAASVLFLGGGEAQLTWFSATDALMMGACGAFRTRLV